MLITGCHVAVALTVTMAVPRHVVVYPPVVISSVLRCFATIAIAVTGTKIAKVVPIRWTVHIIVVPSVVCVLVVVSIGIVRLRPARS